MEELFFGLGIVGLILGLTVLAIYFWALVWLYRDAANRGQPAVLITTLAVFFLPAVLIIWLIIRPKL